jgi:hypothetical protein
MTSRREQRDRAWGHDPAGHLDVTPWVDVEGLVSRADGIEESETCVAVD